MARRLPLTWLKARYMPKQIHEKALLRQNDINEKVDHV
jgi:hypothetical protein